MVLLIKQFVVSLVLFLALDFIWFRFFMKRFATEQLNPLLRLTASGDLNVQLGSAVFVYVLMSLSVVLFLVPRISHLTLIPAAGLSVALGLIVFGVFDFTNLALLKSYPLKFAIIDSLWGGFIYGLIGVTLITFVNGSNAST